MIPSPLVTQTKRNRMIARGAMTAVIAVSTPDHVILRKGFLDHARGMSHLFLGRLAIGVAGFHVSVPLILRDDFVVAYVFVVIDQSLDARFIPAERKFLL